MWPPLFGRDGDWDLWCAPNLFWCVVEDAYAEEELAGWQVELLGEAEGGFGEAVDFVGLEGYVEGLGEDVERLAFGVVDCGVAADGGFVGSA